MEQQIGSSEDFYAYWSNLAKTDPERFEQERKESLEAVISSARPHRQEYLGKLQWRIDVERSRASNPLSATIRIYGMMWDHILKPDGFLAALRLLERTVQGEAFSRDLIPFFENGNARILPFKNS